MKVLMPSFTFGIKQDVVGFCSSPDFYKLLLLLRLHDSFPPPRTRRKSRRSCRMRLIEATPIL
jgi:hypothetical protein